MTTSIRVIVNPASGASELEREALEKIFEEYDVQCSWSMTEGAGDARRLAQEAAVEGVEVIAVYGGDGTVTEAVSGMIESESTLAILPGGTANVVALELGIPHDLEEAAHIVCGRNSRKDRIDVGKMEDRHFLLRVGVGYEARLMEDADRGLKDRFGFAAYLWSAITNLRNTEASDYRFLVDGNEINCRGFTCAIANSGSLGLAGLRLGADVSVRDGLLDVVVIEEFNTQGIFELLAEVFDTGDKTDDERDTSLQEYVADLEAVLQHWQGSEIEFEMDPIQVVQYDGEVLEPVELPIRCEALHKKLAVLVPND